MKKIKRKYFASFISIIDGKEYHGNIFINLNVFEKLKIREIENNIQDMHPIQSSVIINNWKFLGFTIVDEKKIDRYY